MRRKIFKNSTQQDAGSPAINPEPADQRREALAPALPPDSVVTAVAAEEPLPLMMAEMTLWGVGLAVLMIPLSLIGIMTSPLTAGGALARAAALRLAPNQSPQ